MATSLLVGSMEERDSAKKRRKEDYRQDLELQMRERQAARQRERLQDMSVDASGWLDPEKRPDRLKPLGGVHWTEQRGRRDERVRPYHTLFMYDREPGYRTYTGAGGPVDHAYATTGVRGYGGGGGSIVQPISMPYPDNRPIIITGGAAPSVPPPTRTVIEYRDDGTSRELRNLLGLVQAEKDRMRRDNDDFQRRLLRNMEDEKRRFHDQEEDAKRRLERIRREAEENRREAERQRLEAERLRRLAEMRPKSARPATPRTMIYYDMDDYRRRMMEERRRMEELLRATNKPKGKDIWDVQILKKPRYHLNLPPTPASADRANRDNVLTFNDLKGRDTNNRDEFRRIYPDVPVTNRRLEEQQDALLRHQDSNLPGRGYYTDRPREKRKVSDYYRSRKHRSFTTYSEPCPKNRGKLTLRNQRRYSTDTLTDDTWIQPSDTADI